MSSGINLLSLPNELLHQIMQDVLSETGDFTSRAACRQMRCIVDKVIGDLWKEIKRQSVDAKNISLKELPIKIEQTTGNETPSHLQFFKTFNLRLRTFGIALESKNKLITPSQFAAVLKWQEKLDHSLRQIWKEVIKQVSNLKSRASVEEIRAFLNHPANAQTLSSITVLRLNKRSIEALPPEICKFIALEILNLDDNKLSVVPDLSALPALLYLDLMRNQLTTMPDLSAWKSVPTLYLSGNPWMFISENLPDASEYNYIRGQLKAQKKYNAETPLARFYQMIIRQEPKIQSHFEVLPANDKNAIYEMFSLLSGKTAKDLRWEKPDDMLIFYVAVQKAIFTKLEKLTGEQKTAVFSKICQFADSQRTNIRWGEVHAKDSVPRLADALAD